MPYGDGEEDFDEDDESDEDAESKEEGESADDVESEVEHESADDDDSDDSDDDPLSLSQTIVLCSYALCLVITCLPADMFFLPSFFYCEMFPC